jgi:rhamnogalacturonan endolyase
VLSPETANAAFGVTSSGGDYVVDTGAGLVFKVSQSNGDINSVVFNGIEYQSTSKRSQIASGLGTDTTVSATTYGANCIKITISTSPTNTVATSLTHYLMVRNGVNTIYMATYTTAEPAVGELRWITRLQSSKLSSGPVPSDNRNNTGAIESSDVFRMVNGTTRSKYYGDDVTHGKDRAMDLTSCGVRGSGVGVWMVFGNRESSSGGPFYRDIQNQCGSTDQEIYNYMNSGHNQTEAYRVAGVLHGPYALVFNTGALPTLPLDFSWIETGDLNLPGWVSSTNRGAVKGIAYGIPAGFQGVVGFANTTAQYWATVSSTGTYVTPLMKPGNYTVRLYKDELAVATNTVTVVARQTNALNLVSSEVAPNSIFRIGEWSGTPRGFLNAGNIIIMHPQDVRNGNWLTGTFIVGTSVTGDFPAIQFRGTNSPINISFNLAPNQIAALTLRIGITCAYNGGRPKPTIGSWTPSNPSASSQPDSRSFTVGTYRGNNAVYAWTVPASAFVAGANTLSFSPISGSSDLGTWLSAGYVIDCIELSVPNTSPALPAALTSLTAGALNGSQILLSWNDNATNEVNQLIERSTDNVNFTLIAALTENVSQFTDTALRPGTTYYYRARAFNSGGYSSYTPTASATTTLPVITNVQVTDGKIVLRGTGGPAGGPFQVLTSGSVNSPMDSWGLAGTNSFNADGSFVHTNQLGSVLTEFFRLKVL